MQGLTTIERQHREPEGLLASVLKAYKHRPHVAVSCRFMDISLYCELRLRTPALIRLPDGRLEPDNFCLDQAINLVVEVTAQLPPERSHAMGGFMRRQKCIAYMSPPMKVSEKLPHCMLEFVHYAMQQAIVDFDLMEGGWRMPMKYVTDWHYMWTHRDGKHESVA